MVLARSEHSAQRFYSMSAQIRHERNDYYEILERTQKGTLDVTPWMEWFLGCLGRAIDGAPTTLASVLKKARFWQTVRDVPITGRQRLVLNRVLDGFEGKLTTSKWVTIAKCSSDTADMRSTKTEHPATDPLPSDANEVRDFIEHRGSRASRSGAWGLPCTRRAAKPQ